MKEQKQHHQQQQQHKQQQKLLLFATETAVEAGEEKEIDSLEKQPFAMGVEALIATIADKAELIKAIIETRRAKTPSLT
ncbi:MAG TPA: hypothetical protein VJP79_00925 [Nitrososphaera sp.]|nr:hypothetical protein [Nitrososphaera sp.]